MFGTRCTRCGEVRWSIITRVQASEASRECGICGGALAEERRHPGRRKQAGSERRDFVTPVRPSAV